MRIDFHQHVWTDDFRRALERRQAPPLLRGHELVLPRGGRFTVEPDSYSPEARLRELDRVGLDAAVVSLPPTMEPTPELAQPWNDAALELAGASDGRLIPLAYGEARSGFVGAIVAAAELVDLDSVAPMLDRLELAGQLLFVHPGAGESSGCVLAGALAHGALRTRPARPRTSLAHVRRGGRRVRVRWTPELIIYALDLHHRRYLRLPTKREWEKAGDDHPSLMTVRRVFGSWNAAVAAAGFRPRGPGGPRYGPRRRCARTGRWLPGAGLT